MEANYLSPMVIRFSSISTSRQRVPRCESICTNMYRSCVGCCNKKSGHVSPHQCGSCHHKWELSVIELAGLLSKRSQENHSSILEDESEV